MRLNAAVASYIDANDFADDYNRQLRSRAITFIEWLEKEPSVRTLVTQPQHISGFLEALANRGLSKSTIRGYRACLLAVLHYSEPTASLGRHVKRIRRLTPLPTCWSHEDIKKLLATAHETEGLRRDGLEWSTWWPLIIHAGYSTGLRYGDLITLPRSTVKPDGRCMTTQSKTGKPLLIKFSLQAMQLSEFLPTRRREFLPWCYHRETFRAMFKRLVRSCPIQEGSFKWLRRSAGSYYDAENPGAGHLLLGNTRAVFEEHYNDLTISRSEALSAPPL